MERREVIQQLRQIAKSKGVDLTFVEGGGHTKAMFDGKFAATIPGTTRSTS